MRRITGSARCANGRHTPRLRHAPTEEIVRDECRYCGVPVMRTQATRIWFRTDCLA